MPANMLFQTPKPALGRDSSAGRAWLTRPFKPEKKVCLFACLLCKYCPGLGRKGQVFKNTHNHLLLRVCCFCSGPDSQNAASLQWPGCGRKQDSRPQRTGSPSHG